MTFIKGKSGNPAGRPRATKRRVADRLAKVVEDSGIDPEAAVTQIVEEGGLLKVVQEVRPNDLLEVLSSKGFRDLARKHANIAIDALIDTCKQTKDLKARTAAAQVLIERGFGKVAQRQVLSSPGSDALQVQIEHAVVRVLDLPPNHRDDPIPITARLEAGPLEAGLQGDVASSAGTASLQAPTEAG